MKDLGCSSALEEYLLLLLLFRRQKWVEQGGAGLGGGVGTMGHTPTPSRFGATFTAGGGGRGPARGAPGPYIYGVKWPPHPADHFEVPM